MKITRFDQFVNEDIADIQKKHAELEKDPTSIRINTRLLRERAADTYLDFLSSQGVDIDNLDETQKATINQMMDFAANMISNIASEMDEEMYEDILKEGKKDIIETFDKLITMSVEEEEYEYSQKYKDLRDQIQKEV